AQRGVSPQVAEAVAELAEPRRGGLGAVGTGGAVLARGDGGEEERERPGDRVRGRARAQRHDDRDGEERRREGLREEVLDGDLARLDAGVGAREVGGRDDRGDRKSTRLNSSHVKSSYAVFCLKKKLLHGL